MRPWRAPGPSLKQSPVAGAPIRRFRTGHELLAHATSPFSIWDSVVCRFEEGANTAQGEPKAHGEMLHNRPPQPSERASLKAGAFVQFLGASRADSIHLQRRRTCLLRLDGVAFGSLP